jgi:hypothetical protein
LIHLAARVSGNQILPLFPGSSNSIHGKHIIREPAKPRKSNKKEVKPYEKDECP